MKQILSISLLSILNSVHADREYLGLLPHARCDSITKPQKGFWVGRGIESSSKLKFHSECEREGGLNGKCTIMCKDYSSNLILDRTKEGAWDNSMGGLDNPRKKYLVKCKCQTYREDDGTITTENCAWKPRRFWKEKEYREENDLGDAGIGEEEWVQPTYWPADATIVHLRKRRSLEDRLATKEPRMRFYCEDEAPEEIKNAWMLKPEDKSVRQYEDNKGYETCGNMYNLFPTSGGEWKCRLNITVEATGETKKIDVDPYNVPHKAICAWGCTENGGWDGKEARFACVKPWIAQPDNKFSQKEIWRRFRGYGLRVYKQGMLKCSHFDNNLR